MSKLMTSGESETGAAVSCAELKTKHDYEAATVSLNGIKDALDKTFGDAKPYLLIFPAKNDGVKSTDSKSPRKVLITDKIDNASHCFLGDSTSRSYFLRSDRYSGGKSNPKPVVSGSDAHSFDDLDRLEGNVAGFEPTWIKADLTFRGLTQIVFEPESRVHIGNEPEVAARKAIEATKFLSRLRVRNIAKYKGENGSWFKSVDISLNPELVVIIGNKGSGKSALADIVGLLGESRQQGYFSFLANRGGNKKFRQRGFAENFEGEIEWASGAKVSKHLDEDIDLASPEAVRYLPQNYFEQLTNEIEIEDFRREIEDVVFSHVDETDRMGKETFAALQEFKTQQSKQETSALKVRLRELNIEIVELEEQSDPATKRRLEGDLKARKDELLSLEKSKPVDVPKPDKQDDTQKLLAAEIENLTQKKTVVEEGQKHIREILTAAKSRLQRLSLLLESLLSLGAHIDAEKIGLRGECEGLGLNIDEILLATVSREPIDKQIDVVRATIETLEAATNIEFDTETDFSNLESSSDIRAAKGWLQTKIEELKEKLGTPQRKYQNYLERLAKWEAKKKDVLGDQENPRTGTIRNLKTKLNYIKTELGQALTAARESRKATVEKIFKSMQKILTFYSELTQSVEAKLSAVRANEFAVEIDASFVLDRTFSDEFLRFVNKRKRGYFQGASESDSRLKVMISETDWNDFNLVWNFIEGALQKLSIHDGAEMAIKDQITDVKEFYDYLFSLDFLSAKYELRLGDKNLNELSPGEKGLLLLIFYLQLDLDNIPLVIDQPEDNLDNDSIFAVLARCIREAKKNRQVILVTHNPNLAVGADAEQIIYVKLEKAKNYKFSYETGAIENPRINQRIVDVLEGSQPAFVKRRLKYQIE